MTKLQKGSALLIIVIILGILVVVGLLFLNKLPAKNPVATLAPSPSATLTSYITATTDPSLIVGWKTYSAPDFGFEIKYPKEFSYFDNGPAITEVPATTSAQVTDTQARIVDKLTFTDSNKKSFTLNIYPVSTDPTRDTNLGNLFGFADICGLPPNTTSSKAGQVVFNEAFRTGTKGESLVYFCFFGPRGNLLVLRNNSGATEIAMKLMLSTLKFTQ